MKKVLSLFLGSVLFSLAVQSQPREIFLKSADKGFYVDHKVVAKENFYSIGRLYNVNAKEIAAYNKLDMNKGLNVDQVIRIPLSSANFSQTADEGAPVYYKPKDKETLGKVSDAFNKVSLANLRRWNGLRSDNITAGNKLIVGFIIASQLPSVTIVSKEDIVTPIDNDKKIVAEPPPVVTKKEEPKEKPVTKTETPVQQVTTRTNTIDKPSLNGEGYFKNSFEQQVKSSPASKMETVTSGIFKTMSGWQDNKYYLLIDAVQPGTIVKVINPSNKKAVYAKVLGEMSGIRQNEGLNIRISNAAAAALEVSEPDKFVVQVSY